MKTLYEASNAAEAHMLLDVLRQQGISAQIHGEHLQGAIGGLPAAGLIRLVVEEEDYVPARAAIDQWEAAEPAPSSAPQPAPRSRGLQGFMLGLVVGVAGMYAAYKTPAMTDGTDYNRDGLLDEKWTYAANGRPLKLEVDRNLDRKPDYVALYDSRGLIRSAESDDDFDGVFETTHRFRDGNTEASETDTDGDGYADLRSYSESGVLDTVEYINPATGLPLRIEHYQRGKIQFADLDTDTDGKLDTRQTYTPLAEVASRQPISP
jgi:hypothetical protein